ncbi:sigma-70 family RNA polymerase sigma factor, partial [Candidatus Poribacteria bacterium]|nr:sigma-70 family RNA polymerase sigma factor [Candidatus Poribacteria bacterium]
AGDARALEALARRHYPAVYRNAVYRVRDPEVARDIAQEVFLRVTRALPGFRGDAQFKTWVHCITTRACIDHVRSLRARPYMATLDEDDGARSLVAPAPGPDEHAAHGELSRCIDRVVEELPDRQRRVFRMRHYEHMKLTEIARALDRSLGTVKAQLFTARSTLRDSLGPYFAPSPR